MIDELELSLKDMMMKLMFRWRTVVASVIIVGLLFGGVGAWIESKTKKDSTSKEISSSITEQVSTLKARMTETDVYAVELAADMNDYYQEKQNYLSNYIKNSILMNVDPNRVPTLEKMYQIQSKVLEEEKWNSIAKAYAWSLDSTELYGRVCETLKLPNSDEFAKEIISISQVTDGAFVVNIVALTEEEIQKVIEIVDQIIGENYKDIVDAYGEFTVVELESNFQHKANAAILTKQETVKTSFLEIKGKIPALDNFFNETQLRYYSILLSGYEEDVEQEQMSQVNTGNETGKREIISKKYTIIGAIVGLVASVMFIIVTYIFSTKLRKKDDLQLIYAIPTLISIRSLRPNKRILTCVDKFIYTIFNGKETEEEKNALESIVTNIKIIANKKQIEKIYLVGTYNCSLIEKIMEETKHILEKDLNIEYGQFNEKNVGNLEKMLEADMIFMFEATGLSKNKNIQRILDISQLHSINIGGSVIFDTY